MAPPADPSGRPLDVLVVGAGPIGLVLALSLLRAGVRPRIVDARAGITEESRALDVQARTLELYDQLGIADLLVTRGTRIERLAVRVAGRQVSSVELRDVGRGLGPYPFLLCCPQDVHERLLVDELAAAGVEVEWQTTLTSARDAGDRVAVTLVGHDGSPQRVEAAYLCGCDGAHSTVRQELAVPFRGDSSVQAYFVADVTATGPTAPGDPSSSGLFSFCLDQDDFVLVVPARRGRTVRVLGRVPDPAAARTTLGFEDLRAMVERTTATRVDDLGWFSTYQVSHRLADHLRSGRGFLLGDAGHLHSPLGGQGMNTGIADAVNLAWKLAAVLQGRAAPSLLDTYETERLGFARSLVATTDRLFRLIDGSGRRHRLARSVLFRVLLPTLLGLRATRGVAVGSISQIRVHYRSSRLSSGRAGRVRGGDRLPWVEGPRLPDGNQVDHNHRLLRGRDWQLHVYGTASAELQECAEQRGLPLHELGWSTSARTAGLRRDASYLVRPDGYVALADGRQRVVPLERLLDAFALAASAEAPVAQDVSGADDR